MSTQRKMLDLNDDCIYHIYEFLPIIDWCTLRETCTRFRTISEYCFSRRSGTFELRDISDTSYNLVASDVKRVLRNFGKFMKALTINQNHFVGYADFNVLVLFLDRYCESLIDLKFVDINLTKSTIAQCNRLFSTLQRLVIDQWDDEESFSSCLAKCTSLTELEFIRLVIPGDCLAHSRIESLQSFKVSSCYDISYDAMKCFLTINGQLTQVKLFDVHFRNGLYFRNGHNILTDIANTLPKVESLSLRFYIEFMPDPLPLVEMASLKKLEANLTYVVDSNVNAILQGLTLHNKIEHLHLAQFTCTDESIELLCSMKRLKVLKLTDSKQLNADVFKRLAKGLSDLDEIHIIECKDTSFNEVKEFCVHVPNLKKIIFNRIDDASDASPSITQEMFSSLVNIRKKQPTKEILLIFLNDDDLREIESEFKWCGTEDTLVKRGNVLKLVPLEKEHRSTVYEYGSGFRYHSKQFLDDIDVGDESGSDDSSFDGSDDHWVFG